MATASFWAQAVQEGSAMTISESAIRALGKPLFWHDVRNFNITNSAGTTDDYRRTLMSTTATVNHNLERKGELQNWGDHEELSRATDDILNHSETVTGQAEFHSRLSRALFSAAETSQDWGDVVIRCSDGPALPVGGTARPYIVTLHDAIPTVETAGAAGNNTQLSYSVPFAAQKLSIALTE